MHSAASGHARVLAAPTAPFLARRRSFEPTLKFSEAPEALRARFFARSGPPGLDFGLPGRSWARFWRPKRLDLRGRSTLARGRCVHCPRLTKHCVGARILSFELSRNKTKTLKSRPARAFDGDLYAEHARTRHRGRLRASRDRSGHAFRRPPATFGLPGPSQD